MSASGLDVCDKTLRTATEIGKHRGQTLPHVAGADVACT